MAKSRAFRIGAVSAVDISGRTTARALRNESKKARSEARSDWHAVGRDLQKSIAKAASTSNKRVSGKSASSGRRKTG